ncbi:hypothetical protein ACWNYI_00775 [Candidatus Vidania fulgoroideorum]
MIKKKKKKEKKNNFNINIKKSNKHFYLILFSNIQKKILTSSSTKDKFYKKLNDKKFNIKNLKILCENLILKIINFNIKFINISIDKNKCKGKIKLIVDILKFFLNESNI